MVQSKSDRPCFGNHHSESTDQLCSTSDTESLHLEANGLFYDTNRSIHGGSVDYSFVQQLSQLHEYSTGSIDFISKTADALYREVCVKCLLLLTTIVPIIMLAAGTSYRLNCPEVPMLPVYLIVGGASGVLKIAFILVRHRKSPDYEQIENQQDGSFEGDAVLSRFIRFTDLGMNVFVLIWFIFGNYWYFSNPTPNFHQTLSDPNDWCDRVFYQFYFIMLIVVYVILGMIIMLIVFLVLFYHQRFFKKIFGRLCFKNLF
ncbi:hypothetical protein ACF0H5_011196 [Mactra antiquata]